MGSKKRGPKSGSKKATILVGENQVKSCGFCGPPLGLLQVAHFSAHTLCARGRARFPPTTYAPFRLLAQPSRPVSNGQRPCEANWLNLNLFYFR